MELLTPFTKSLPSEIPESTVIKLAKDICSALTECKRHGVFYFNLKPQNIFVAAHGDYKFDDFAISTAIKELFPECYAMGPNVPLHMFVAPEVYNHQPYGSRAVIYSLGLVLYWLLNERRIPFVPFPPAKLMVGQEEDAMLRRLYGEPLPPPAHGSEKLKKIVLKACAFDPQNRYSDAAEMLRDLACFTGEAVPPQTVVPDSTPVIFPPSEKMVAAPPKRATKISGASKKGELFSTILGLTALTVLVILTILVVRMLSP